MRNCDVRKELGRERSMRFHLYRVCFQYLISSHTFAGVHLHTRGESLTDTCHTNRQEGDPFWPRIFIAAADAVMCRLGGVESYRAVFNSFHE